MIRLIEFFQRHVGRYLFRSPQQINEPDTVKRIESPQGNNKGSNDDSEQAPTTNLIAGNHTQLTKTGSKFELTIQSLQHAVVRAISDLEQAATDLNEQATSSHQYPTADASQVADPSGLNRVSRNSHGSHKTETTHYTTELLPYSASTSSSTTQPPLESTWVAENKFESDVSADGSFKAKPDEEDVTESIPQSSKVDKTSTHAKQMNDKVSGSERVLVSPLRTLQVFPQDSSSLRKFLESTSSKKPHTRQSTPTNEQPVAHVTAQWSRKDTHVSTPAKTLALEKNPPPPVRLAAAPKVPVVPIYAPSPCNPVSKKSHSAEKQSASSSRSPSPKNSEPVVPKDSPAISGECPHTDECLLTPSETQEKDTSLISLNDSCGNTKSLIGNVAKKIGMKELTTENSWNVLWLDHGASIQTFQKLKRYQRINRFPGAGELLIKNNLARNTTKMRRLFPEEYDFVPETWCLPWDVSKVEQYSRAHEDQFFIVKPNDGSCGRGIIITRNISQLRNFTKKICQVYIHRPLLIDGYKFDLRVYTLITSCRPLRLFVYNEGLARFATEKYEEPNQQNESNTYMHLTNYTVNKHSPSYIVDDTKGTLRRLSTINKWMIKNKIDAKKVWDSMDDAIIKTIISFLPALRHYYRVSFPDQSESISCFQILGFDIIFNNALKPYVLEVNNSPSLHADVPLDKEMTEALIQDTFNILNLAENNRNQVLTEEKKWFKMRLLSPPEYKKSLHREKEQADHSLTQSRIEWENKHMGNFRKLYPNEKMKHYKKFISAAQDIF